MSRPGIRVIAALTRASGSPGFETSADSQPAALICLAVLAIEVSSRDEMKTSAPSPINASEHARPRPRLAEVTSALRPFSPRSIPSPLLSRAGVHVPLGHVLEALDGLDDAVDWHAMDPLRDRAGVM